MLKSDIVRKHHIQHINNERVIIGYLKSSFVVGFKGSFQDRERLYMALEWVQRGDLYSLLQGKGKFSYAECLFYASEIAYSLVYLHKNHIIYRDLKPENVLITANGHIKLADFGFAKVLKGSSRTYSVCGSPNYMAPEVIRGSGYGYSADWWSFGVLVYEMIHGKTPFEGSNAQEVMENCVMKEVEIGEECVLPVRSLIEGLLRKRESERFSEMDVMSHGFFKEVNWKTVQKRQMKPPFLPRIRVPEAGSETVKTGEAVDASLFLSFG